MARHILLAVSLVALIAAPAFAQPSKKGAAAPAPAADDPIVARVNGQVLHRSDIEIEWHYQIQIGAVPPDVAQKATPEQIYPRVLNKLVADMLLAQAGRKAKVDGNPTVKELVTHRENEIISSSYVASLQRATLTEAKLREAYDQYAKNAPQEEEVHAFHILVPTEQEAKDIIEQLKKGADFATLAKEKTTDVSSKASGGDLGYFKRQDMLPEFSAAAFALKKGEFTQSPVHTQYGWHVIKVEDRRPGKAGTYEQVAPQLAQQMTQQMVGEKLQQLKNEGKIEIFDLNGKPLASAAQPPAAAAQKPAPQAAPTLSLPGEGLGGTGGAPGAPKLSPATAPDQLKH